MSDLENFCEQELDEIEVVDLEEYACAGKPVPKRVKYYLIKVDKDKIRVQSPITAEEVLIAADLLLWMLLEMKISLNTQSFS